MTRQPSEEKKVKVSLSHVLHFVTPWAVACQALLSTDFSRQKYRSGWPFPSLGDRSTWPRDHTGVSSISGDSLPSEPPGKAPTPSSGESQPAKQSSSLLKEGGGTHRSHPHAGGTREEKARPAALPDTGQWLRAPRPRGKPTSSLSLQWLQLQGARHPTSQVLPAPPLSWHMPRLRVWGCRFIFKTSPGSSWRWGYCDGQKQDGEKRHRAWPEGFFKSQTVGN